MSFISLTFDDGLNEHLDNAIPLLSERGLKGTFYAHLSASSLSARFDEWRDAANAGHEIGNHTIFHPAVSTKTWVRQGNALETYSVDRMMLEIETAEKWLDAIDGGKARTFSYPCSNSVVGNFGLTNRALFRMGFRNTRLPRLIEQSGLDIGNSRTRYVDALADMFIAARSGGLYLDQQAPHISGLQRMLLPSAAIETSHGFKDMKGFVERGLAAGGWPILQFHGIGGGHHMDCELADFIRFADWLASHHSEKVVTVVQGAHHLFSRPTDNTGQVHNW